MQVFIHIGYPKTGSSAIQSHIFTNQRWLENHGIYIPKSGYASGLGHCFLLTGGNPLHSATGKDDSNQEAGQLSMLSKELGACSEAGFSKALISWEGLALLGKDSIENISAALRDHQVTIRAYVRDPVDLYQSAVLQEIESLWNYHEEILEDDHNIRDTRLLGRDFSSTLGEWESCFDGNIQIRVRVFDRNRLVDNNIVQDFLNWLDLTPDNNFYLQSRPTNHSLDTKAASILLVANAAGLHYGGLQKLSRALSTVTGKQKKKSQGFISGSSRSTLESLFEETNKLLANKYPPENAIDDPLCFAKHDATTEVQNPSGELAYLREIYRELMSPALEIWEGGPLASRNLGILTRPPNRGWTLPQMKGIWAVGSKSTLAFLLPEHHPVEGPRAIRLSIGGTYAPGYTSTTLTASGVTADRNLSEAEVEIAITDKVRSHGVELILEHYPENATDQKSEDKKNPPAFRLELLAYCFIWDGL